LHAVNPVRRQDTKNWPNVRSPSIDAIYSVRCGRSPTRRDRFNILSQPVAGQDWLLQRDGSYYRFRNAGTSGWLALTVNSNVAGTGKPIIQWTNTAGNGDQLWDMKPVSGGTLYTYTLRNPKSNKCLAIPGSSTATGVQAIVWPCQANNHDQWWWIHDIN
jgi:Ricin-type beta-trefoil lectin domain